MIDLAATAIRWLNVALGFTSVGMIVYMGIIVKKDGVRRYFTWGPRRRDGYVAMLMWSFVVSFGTLEILVMKTQMRVTMVLLALMFSVRWAIHTMNDKDDTDAFPE